MELTGSDIALIITAVGGIVAAITTYKLGLHQTSKDKEVADEQVGVTLIEKAFAISEQLQESLKKDLDDLRGQVKDTQSMINLLVDENKKLLLENDKLMRANHQMTEENNMLLRENKTLGEQIVTLTGRITTLEDAIKAPKELLEAVDGHPET